MGLRVALAPVTVCDVPRGGGSLRWLWAGSAEGDAVAVGGGGPRLASRWLIVGGGEVFAGAPQVRVSPDRRQIAYRWTRGDVPDRWAVDGVDWSGWAGDDEVADWDELAVSGG